MSELSEAIDSVYSKFVMRDLLSFITPGAAVVGAVSLSIFQPSDISTFLEKASIGVYVLLFGICYMFGFAVQSFGAQMGLIKFYDPKDIPEAAKDNGRMRTREGMEAVWAHLVKFNIVANKESKEQRERLVILKQMSGNCAVAMLIATVLFAIKAILVLFSITVSLPTDLAWVLPLLVVTILGFIFLRVGHRIHREQQMAWEKTILLFQDDRKHPPADHAA